MKYIFKARAQCCAFEFTRLTAGIIIPSMMSFRLPVPVCCLQRMPLGNGNIYRRGGCCWTVF